jgi:hypothetical protein
MASDDAEADSGTAAGDGESAPTEVAVVASAAIETASEDAWSEIQAYLAQLDPYSFQDLVGSRCWKDLAVSSNGRYCAARSCDAQCSNGPSLDISSRRTRATR